MTLSELIDLLIKIQKDSSKSNIEVAVDCNYWGQSVDIADVTYYNGNVIINLEMDGT